MKQTAARASGKGQSGITITLALSMLLASLGTSIANIALPTLVTAFSAPFAQVQMVVVAYLAAMTISVVVAGQLGDRFGLRSMLMAGLGLFTVASLLCGMATNLSLLIGARLLQGIGAAFLMTLSMALMRQTASEARVGHAMGLLGTVSALGTVLGPVFGGLLMPMTGWRGIFWVQVPLAAISLILAFLRLPPDEQTNGKASLAGHWLKLNSNLVPNLLVNLLVAAVMMTTLVVGPFYLALALGLEQRSVGFVMAVGPAIAIVSGVPSGQFVDSWGSDLVLAMGLALLVVGAFLLAILPNTIGVAGYVLSIVVLTPGYQLFQAANNTDALADVPGHLRGTVSGLLSLSRNIGLITGASFMGAVFAFGVGTHDLIHAGAGAIAEGMQLAFLLGGTMMMVAMAVALRYRILAKRRV